MKGITDATDPNLSRFLHRNDGRLLPYHGWLPPLTVPAATLGYYTEVVDATFGGDIDAARQKSRLCLVARDGTLPGPGRVQIPWTGLARWSTGSPVR